MTLQRISIVTRSVHLLAKIFLKSILGSKGFRFPDAEFSTLLRAQIKDHPKAALICDPTENRTLI